jgi:hypothetical protein
MLAISIVALVMLIKIDIRIIEHLGYLTAGDPWAGGVEVF